MIRRKVFGLVGVLMLVAGVLLGLLQSEPGAADDQTSTSEPAVKHIDLANGAVLRGILSDGSAAVNLLSFKDGTLRLCDDPYFYSASDTDHLGVKVIEVRNPGSAYPDFRLPVTRSKPNGTALDGDSKLVVRSASMIETNDPAELNLIRTGDDNYPNKDENGTVANGAVTGLIRWMGRRSRSDNPHMYSGYAKDAEIIARNYGTSEADHFGALIFQVFDYRYKKDGNRPGVMLVMKPGVRIGDLDESPGISRTGAMLEVDSVDERPVIFRRANLQLGKSVDVVLATGNEGEAAAENNTLAQLRAIPTSEGSLQSRLELRTNHGNRLESDWILPVPMAHITGTSEQTLPSGDAVVVTFNKVEIDTASMFKPGESNTRLVCVAGGKYVASAAVEFAANGQGSRQLIIRLNGREQVVSMRISALDGETTLLTLTTPPIEMKPGDFVEVLVRQTSGGNLSLLSHGEQPASFSLTRAG